MATGEAAQHLDANELGLVAPGKVADLILVDGNPEADISVFANCLDGDQERSGSRQHMKR